jgi:hypothetical protein
MEPNEAVIPAKAGIQLFVGAEPKLAASSAIPIARCGRLSVGVDVVVDDRFVVVVWL